MSRKQRTLSETLADNRTITVNEFISYGVLDFDPGGGARDVTLPAATLLGGHQCMIRNSADGAETLTVKNAAADVVASIVQDESAMIYCHGTVIPTYTAVVTKKAATA